MRHAIQNSNFLCLNSIVRIMQFWHSAAGHGQGRASSTKSNFGSQRLFKALFLRHFNVFYLQIDKERAVSCLIALSWYWLRRALAMYEHDGFRV